MPVALVVNLNFWLIAGNGLRGNDVCICFWLGVSGGVGGVCPRNHNK